MEKKRVLIVDDEEDLTWSITKRFSRESEAFEVSCTNSGNNALELMTKQQFSLLVTDIRMPGMNGIQLLDEVKGRYPEMHVIVMTAYGSIELRESLKKWGELGYIEKPFDMNDLRRLIIYYLDSPAAQQIEMQS